MLSLTYPFVVTLSNPNDFPTKTQSLEAILVSLVLKHEFYTRSLSALFWLLGGITDDKTQCYYIASFRTVSYMPIWDFPYEELSTTAPAAVVEKCSIVRFVCFFAKFVVLGRFLNG